jgi:hypothetical protein
MVHSRRAEQGYSKEEKVGQAKTNGSFDNYLLETAAEINDDAAAKYETVPFRRWHY